MVSADRRQQRARKGGKARARKLTPERLQEIARLGGVARRLSGVERRKRDARKGGRARAIKLTSERRREIASLGGRARRANRRADAGEVKKRIAAMVLTVSRGYTTTQIERHFGWRHGDVERWIAAGKLLW